MPAASDPVCAGPRRRVGGRIDVLAVDADEGNVGRDKRQGTGSRSKERVLAAAVFVSSPVAIPAGAQIRPQ